jgi:predicted DNA repair protein MutK
VTRRASGRTAGMFEQDSVINPQYVVVVAA